jgi:hypothetical protein
MKHVSGKLKFLRWMVIIQAIILLIIVIALGNVATPRAIIKINPGISHNLSGSGTHS